MGLLSILARSSGEQKMLKRAETLLMQGRAREAERVLTRLSSSYTSVAETEEERKKQAAFWTLYTRALLAQSNPQAIQHALTAYQLGHDEAILREAVALVEKLDLVSPEATKLILTLAEETTGERGFLLAYAKRIVGKKVKKLDPAEHEVVLLATKAFTLWKAGSELLAEEFLEEGREDSEAIAVYRIAYPNKKDDDRLVQILLKHLVESGERSEFAAQLYEDYLARGNKDDRVLKLLAEYHISKKEITPQSIGYIEEATRKCLLDKDAMEKLSAYLLRTRKEFLNKKALLLNIYRAGYYNKNVLAFLAIAFAEEGNFSDDAMKAYEDALRNNLLTKRITLLLTEHFLASDRNDEFACRVYEHYLSSWPERRQPRIYYLLSKNYIQKKRTDEQAQRIYEDALNHFPEFTEVLPYLAASYLAYDTRQPKAFSVYEKAYPIISDDYTKRQIALILAEQRIEGSNFDRKTLEYIEMALPIASERKKGTLLDARTKCFLALERTDPYALSIYVQLYLANPQASAENERLITLLSDTLLEPPAGFEIDPSLRMEILYRRFEVEKFTCPEKISFYLLEDVLANNLNYKYRLQLVVRCFEIDAERTAEKLFSASSISLLREVGRFYLERYNYPLASKAFTIRNRYEPSDENTYQLGKILVYEGRTAEALQILSSLTEPELQTKALYWKGAAFQQENNVEEAEKLFTYLEEKSDSIPGYLIAVRKGINAELAGDYDAAIAHYRRALGDENSKFLHRWIEIEIGLCHFRKNDVAEAVNILRRLYRQNPNGRAEQRNFSYVLCYSAYLQLLVGEWDAGLSSVLEAVEVNRNDRLLRSVAVELLLNFGKRFFFNKNYEMAVKILETAHQILPRDTRIKTYLAYSYHLLHNYSHALIYYRDITWSDETPMLERSQAYCYLANNQPSKAWKVFLDLKKRGALTPDDIPLLIDSFLADVDAKGGRAFKDIEFREEEKAPVPFASFYIHDGLYDRALNLLTKSKDTKAQELQKLWFLGKAAALKGDRKLACTYWKELLNKCLSRETHTETKITQLVETGLAFLQAGYAQEAMETWEKLRELDPEYPHLAKLYACTLDLNAFSLAQKGNLKIAIGEWEKAFNYDPSNTNTLHNLAISYMMADDFETSAIYWRKVIGRWKVMLDRNPTLYAHLSVAIGEVERLLSDVFVARQQLEEDVYSVKTEEMVDYFQRANQFYWILGLDKRASRGQIERAYFRLIKIFDPERHPADFMLLEEAYANLTDEIRRSKVDIFAFNPVDAQRLREIILGTDTIPIFEDIGLTVRVPGPDYSQLTPDETPPENIVKSLTDTLTIYFRLGDQAVI